MAKVMYGPIVSDARKKIGGIVATKGHAGNFMRKKVSPIQPRTQAQMVVRSQFSAHSKAWAGLGATVIAAFNALAKGTPKKDRFGASVTQTGLQHFQGLSRNIDTVVGTPLSACPASLSASTPGDLTVVATHAGGTFTVVPTTYPPVGEAAAVFAGPPLGLGRSFVGKNYRFIKAFAYQGSPVAFNIASAYGTKYGAFTTGKQIAVMVKNINITTGAAGQASAKLQTTV